MVKIQIPSFEDDPEYAQEKSKYQQIVDLEIDIEKKINEIQVRLAAPQEDDSGQLIEQVLQFDGNNEPRFNDLTDLRRKLSRLRIRLADVRKARDQQKRKLGKMEASLSKKICASVRDNYEHIVKSIAKTIKDLAHQIDEERKFMGELQERGIHTDYLPRCNVRHIGSINDPVSYVNHWLKEAAEHGYIEYSPPQEKCPYDDIPVDKSVECLAAGPDGIRRVNVSRGGKLETIEWISKPENDRNNSKAAWTV